MTSSLRNHYSIVAGCLLAVLAAPAQAQTLDMLTGHQAPDPIVTGAPYAADSIIVVTLTRFGAPVEQRVVARLYRDNAGRVRREQTVTGQETPKTSEMSDLVVTISDPVAGVVITLNPATRTAHRMVITDRMSRNAAPQPASPLPESLGTQQIEGLTVTGQRTVTTLPPGTDGRPVEISDERWESRDLGLALIERHRDSRTGIFEHRLTNISRTEPAPQLFVIPPSYTVVDVPIPPGR